VSVGLQWSFVYTCSVYTYVRFDNWYVMTWSMDRNRDSSFGIGTGLRAGFPGNVGSTPGRGKRFIHSPKRPDRF
jgi:hypothetical protein